MSVADRHTVLPPTRKIAQQIGCVHYFNGNPCKHGHIAPRLTGGGNCTVCHAECVSRWHKENPEKVLEKHNRFRSKPEQKVKVRAQQQAYQKRRYAEDPHFKTMNAMRSFLNRIRFEKGGKRTSEVLGYTKQELVADMESKFQPGMTWDNHGAWEIDHIKPVMVMIREGETEPSVINALSNLQPLWKEDNRNKRAKWESADVLL